jgi:hypothetical protein
MTTRQTAEDYTMTEGEQPATKGDFLRLERKVDSLTTSLSVLNTAVAVLQARPEHKQPCDDFLAWKASHSPCKELCGHLAEHKEVKGDWRGGLISFFFGLISSAIVGTIGYIIGTHRG